MADIYLGKGDILPVLTAALQNADGTPIDLTGAAVALIIETRQDVETVRVATVTDAALGLVSYTWVAADSATRGTYRVRWRVTFAGGAMTTVPNDGDLVLRVS